MPDESWLKALYEEHYQLLYSVGRLFTGADEAPDSQVEDMIQETFLILWRKRGALFTHPNIGGWLVETLRRGLLHRYTKKRRAGAPRSQSLDAVDMDLVTGGEKVFPLPEDALEIKDRLETLKTLLGERDAALFYRYFALNLTARELAREMNVSEDCLRMRVTRLRKKVLLNRELFLGIMALFAVRFFDF